MTTTRKMIKLDQSLYERGDVLLLIEESAHVDQILDASNFLDEDQFVFVGRDGDVVTLAAGAYDVEDNLTITDRTIQITAKDLEAFAHEGYHIE